jgi:hypothetical protein
MLNIRNALEGQKKCLTIRETCSETTLGLVSIGNRLTTNKKLVDCFLFLVTIRHRIFGKLQITINFFFGIIKIKCCIVQTRGHAVV